MTTSQSKRQPEPASNNPVLNQATAYEKAAVLDQLLDGHPELVDEADQLASAILTSVDVDSVATNVAHELESLGIEELATRAGRVRGRGYIHETDAAWEVLEETLEPFLTDIRRRADLGLVEATTTLIAGTITGLHRLHGTADGSLIAFAGDDAIDTLTDTVICLADDIGLKLHDPVNQN